MTRLVLERLAHGTVTLIGVTLVMFVLIMSTGDPVAMMLSEFATPEQVAELRHQLGLDRPVLVQYVGFMRRAFQGDFGTSLSYRGVPAIKLVTERIPATAELALSAMGVAVLIGIPLGVFGAYRRGSWVDFLSTGVAVVGQSVPVFWVGIMMILIFSLTLRWLPISGRGGAQHLVLPSISLGWYVCAAITRLSRSSMAEVLQQDYIRTARAKGVMERVVLFKHALKNAAIPLVTMIGVQTGALLGGAVVTETVFSWPGVGRLTVASVLTRDYPVAVASVVFIASVYVLINLVVDLVYVFLDPRIRYC